MTDTKQIIDMDIDALQSNPLQPRGIITPESLVDLVDSIKAHGVLEPLVAAKTPAGFQLIAGERRWRASKLAGLRTVPVIIKETTPQGMLEMAIVENVQRTDLNPIDRAKAFERLMMEFNLTNAEIAQRIGKSPSYISNTMRLLQLPDALKDGLLTGLITEGHARALSAIEDARLMIEAYKIVLRESGSVRRAEELARKMRAQMGYQPKQQVHPTNASWILSEDVDKMRDDFQKFLGNKSVVRLSRSRSETRLTIVLKGNIPETDPIINAIYDKLKN